MKEKVSGIFKEIQNLFSNYLSLQLCLPSLFPSPYPYLFLFFSFAPFPPSLGAKPGLMSVFVDERKPVLFLKQAIADAASVDINEVNLFC